MHVDASSLVYIYAYASICEHSFYQFIFIKKELNYTVTKDSKYWTTEKEDDKILPFKTHMTPGIIYTRFRLIFNYKVFL